MYKKIKAIKNNSLKKSTMFVAMAALASCAVLADLEKIGFDCGSQTFAGFYNMPYWGNGSYYRDRSFDLNSLDKSDRDHLERFNESVQNVCREMIDSLSPSAVANSVISGGGSAGFNTAIGEIITKSEQYNKLINAMRSSYNQYGLAAMVDIIDSLGEFQDYIMKNLIILGVQLDLARVKSDIKLEKLRNKEADLAKYYNPDLTSLAGIAGIKGSKDGDALEEAKRLYEKALECLCYGKVFTPDGFSTDANAWSNYGAVSFGKKYKSERVSGTVAPFFSAMQTLLIYNKAINNVFRKMIIEKTMRNLLRLRQQTVVMGAQGFAATVVKKETWFQFLRENGYADVLVLPLLTVGYSKGSGFDGVDVDDATGTVDVNRSEFVSHLVKAIHDPEISPGDLLRNFINFSNAKVSSARGDLKVKYDLADVVKNALGDTKAKDLFKQFDEVTQEALSEDGLRDAAEAGLIGEDVKKKDFEKIRTIFGGEVGSESEDYASIHFVSKDDRLVETVVEANADGENANYLSYVLAMPETIRLRGLAECCKNDYTANVMNRDYWKTGEIRPWVNQTTFIQGAEKAVASFTSIYKQAKKLSEEVNNIKKENISESDKEKFNRAKIPVTNFLVRDTNNNIFKGVNVRAVFDAATGHREIVCDDLDKDIKNIRFTLCPQTAEKTENNKNKSEKPIEYTPLRVVNGSASADVTKETVQPGNYELHAHQVIYDEQNKEAIKELRFLFKINFSVDVKKVKPASAVKITTTETGPGAVLDYENAKVTINEDKSVTVRLKCKDKSAAAATTLVNGYWDDGAKFDPEHSKFALQAEPDGEYYTFTSNKSQSGKKQLHVYRGEVEAGKYDGKIVFDVSDTEELASSDLDITSILAKDSAKDSDEQAFVKKRVKLSLPSQCFDWNSDTIEYEIVSSNDTDTSRPHRRGSAKVRRLKRGNNGFSYFGIGSGGSDVYEAEIELPKTDSQYKIRITNVKPLRIDRSGFANTSYYLLSNSSINHANYKTGEELSFAPTFPYDRSFGGWNLYL